MIKVGYDGGAAPLTFTRVVELPLSVHERITALDRLHEPSTAQQRLPISTRGFHRKQKTGGEKNSSDGCQGARHSSQSSRVRG